MKNIFMLRAFLLFLCVVFFTSCANLKHAVVFEDTVIGADLATNPKDASVRAVFGYERQTDAVIPKSCVTEKDVGGKKVCDKIEALSVLLNSRVKMDWFDETLIQQSFSTGEAAVNLAKNPGLMVPFLSTNQPSAKPEGH